MKQNNRGKYFSFRFNYVNEVTTYSGYLLDFNADWVLLKYNPCDYQADGYILLRKKNISHYKRENKERFTEKILNLKGHQPKANETIPISDIKSIVNYLTAKYGVFQFDMRSNSVCWLGKVKKITGQNLDLHYLTPRGKWNNKMRQFPMGSIRTIQFDTDYINSLMLIGTAKKK